MELLNDFLEQLLNLRTEMLFALVLYVLGFVLKRVPAFPNGWIPLVIISAGGVGGFFVFDNPGAADPNLRHPEIRAVMIGLVVGAAVWFFHDKLMRHFEGFLPASLRSDVDSTAKQGTTNQTGNPS